MITMLISEKIGNSFAGANSHLSDEVFAYIAVSGDNFCSSASDNYVLQNKHQKQFNFTNKIAKVFIFLGKLAICFLNVWLTRITMKAAGCYDELAAPIIMTIFVGILSFTNASMFLCVFDAAVIGMMSCAAIDMKVLMNGVLVFFVVMATVHYLTESPAVPAVCLASSA